MKIYAIGILEWNIELINPPLPPPTQTKTTCPPIQTSPPIWFSKKSVHHIILASKKKFPPHLLGGGGNHESHMGTKVIVWKFKFIGFQPCVHDKIGQLG